jgi:hypothetical protein
MGAEGTEAVGMVVAAMEGAGITAVADTMEVEDTAAVAAIAALPEAAVWPAGRWGA